MRPARSPAVGRRGSRRAVSGRRSTASPFAFNLPSAQQASDRVVHPTAVESGARRREARSPRDGCQPRIGVVHNARARHNIGRHLPRVLPGCDHVMPNDHDELHKVLARFAGAGVDTLIVDGGDGTVRDIVSGMARDLPGFRPRIAIVPAGKTNALASDLGIRAGWSLAEALAAIDAGRTRERAPVEVWREGAGHADLAGFIFGGGAFVAATRGAQQTHRFGAFNGLAVGLSIAAAVGRTVFGGRTNALRRGERMRIIVDAHQQIDGPHYLFLASTLSRMPLRIRPFGRERSGLKMLRVEAPAFRLAIAAPIVLAGGEQHWLPDWGYHRRDARRIDLSLGGGFVLDGETFDGGVLSLRQGAPISFIVP